MPENTKTRLYAAELPRWFWVMFFILSVFVYFYGLTIPFLGPDEPRYAQVAREMFERGDWITPTIGGFNWFEKPALLYWLEIISYHIFGVNEFAARLGPALFGLGTIFSLWLIARYVTENKILANWCAMIAASTLGILVFSRGASFDIIVTFPITASLAGFIIYDALERKPVIALFFAYFFVGVALLAKGLVGLIFPFAIIGAYHLFLRRWPKRKFVLSALWGIPLLIFVASTWYLPMYLLHGDAFVNEFIIQQHFQRFTSNKYQHPQPFSFFFWVLPLMTIPWLPFFAHAIWKQLINLISKLRSRPSTSRDATDGLGKNLRLLAWAWIIVPLLFFSFSGSKLPGYILPAVPPAILLATDQILPFMRKASYRIRLVTGLATATLLAIVIVLTSAAPGFIRKETVKGLIESADSKGYSRLLVAGLFTVSHNAEFYAAGRLVRDADGRQHKFLGAHEIREYLETNGGPILVLVPLEHVRNLTDSVFVQGTELDENGELAITLVSVR